MKTKMKLTREEKIKYILAHPELSYEDLAKELRYKSADSVRGFCKREKLPNKRNNSQAQRTGESVTDLVEKNIARKKYNIIELANLLNVTPKKIEEAIKELQSKNKVVENYDDKFQLSREIKKIDVPHVINLKKYKEVTYKIGVISDNHIGSKYERNDVLNAMYDRFASAGVDTVYNCGNMIDGEARFNKYDIYVYGVDAQVRNLLEKYPQRPGITTHFITGDDHEGWYVQREHINIGQKIEDDARRMGRKDLIHLGYMERDIEYKNKLGSSIIRVIHAGGGSSYAVSYTSQKYVESLQGGEKPAIVLVGHYHKFNYSYLRNVHVIQAGCTEDQTPFMRKKRLEAHVGGCIIEVTQNELGVFTSVKVQWFPYYDRKFYAYQW